MKLFFLLTCIYVFGNSMYIQAQSYEELIEKSYEYVDKQDFLGAEECLKAAMRLESANPFNYALLTNLGTIQRRQGKLEDALLSYTAALSRQPQNELILQNRAELYTEMGQMEKALNDYQVILTLNPLNEDALYQRGLIYLQSNNPFLAEADFDEIFKLNPETVKGRLGFAILEKARKNYVESEVILNYLIEKYPNYWLLYEERAELYLLMDKKGRSMSDLNKLFSAVKHPSAELYVLRGKVKLAQFEKESAALDFKKAQELGYDAKTIESLLKLTF